MYIRDDVAALFGSNMGASINKVEYFATYSHLLNLALCVVYRPEESTGFEEALREIEAYIKNKGPPLPNVLVVGDFNFPQIY